MSKKDLLVGLTDEQIAKVKSCKNNDEILKLADEEGVELSDEQLKAVSGGFCSSEKKKDEENQNNDQNNTDKDGNPVINPF